MALSLIIFANIMARLPSAIFSSIELNANGVLYTILIVLVILVVIVPIIYVERGQRRIPVSYAKRVTGRRMMGGQSTYLPIKVNTAGVIPIIFASSILYIPAQLAVFFPNVGWIQGFSNSPVGGLAQLDPLGGSHRVFFAYFYTAMVFNPNDTADNLKRQGGFIPGIRPGTPTAQYIKNVLNCITLPGAIFIALVAVVPSILFFFTGNTLIPGVRRHLDPHHGGRCARHDEQGREPAQDARLRGFLQIGSRVGESLCPHIDQRAGTVARWSF